MNKKQTIKKTAAMILGLAIAMGATGCEFFTKDSKKDLNQTVATVDISSTIEDGAIKTKFQELELSGSIKKRELVSYYLSVGYYYVDNYGYTYEDTFNMLLNALVNREILVQHAATYFLGKGIETSFADYKAAYPDEEEDVVSLRYLLSDGKVDNVDDYNLAVYTLKKNINDSIDSIESSSYITLDEEHSHGTARTTPNGLNTEKEDYYPSKVVVENNEEKKVVDYDVYTGRNGAGACGEYEKVEGSTVTSRQKAYNAFLANLQNYNLIGSENTSKVDTLKYYHVELVSLLEQRLIDKYYKDVENTVYEEIDETYVNARYNELFTQNKLSNENNPTAFASAMDSASATSFLTYAPVDNENTFGYVYNILLPFSEEQEIAYEEAKGKNLSTDALYVARNQIAKEIKGEDLRESWISMDDHVNHSYKVGEEYFFFEDGVTENDRYEKLTQYAGQYPFQGTVTVSEDGDEYEFDKSEYKVDIDAFMNIFNEQINLAVTGDKTNVVASGSPVQGYYDNLVFETGKGDDKETDYSKFTYYNGKVDLAGETAADFFNPDSKQYKALSAVNELMFAYSTDTGCLNTFMGYSVSPYGTNFVKEFEWAAQEVVKEGVGSYKVCLTDYGWHIIYCSFSYKADYVGSDENENLVYGTYYHDQKDVDGTFSNLFYEYVKSTAYTSFSTEEQSKTLKKYDGIEKRYEDRYKDLYDFDNYQ